MEDVGVDRRVCARRRPTPAHADPTPRVLPHRMLALASRTAVPPSLASRHPAHRAVELLLHLSGLAGSATSRPRGCPPSLQPRSASILYLSGVATSDGKPGTPARRKLLMPGVVSCCSFASYLSHASKTTKHSVSLKKPLPFSYFMLASVLTLNLPPQTSTCFFAVCQFVSLFFLSTSIVSFSTRQ